MSKCAVCGAVDEPGAGIEIGVVNQGGDSICTVCRADELEQNTRLSNREAQVAAYKQLLGATNERTGQALGSEKSAADEYSRRVRQKARTAQRTVNELSEFL